MCDKLIKFAKRNGITIFLIIIFVLIGFRYVSTSVRNIVIMDFWRNCVQLMAIWSAETLQLMWINRSQRFMYK